MSGGGSNNNTGGGVAAPAVQPTLAPMPTAPLATPNAGTTPTGTSIFDSAAGAQNQAGGIFEQTGQAGNFGASMNQYINPYQQQVLDRSISRQVTDRDIALNEVGANADAAGAFGGSRHGLVESQIYDRSNRNIGDLAAGMNREGFLDQANLANTQINQQQNAAGGLLNTAGQGFNFGESITGRQQQDGTQQQNLIQQILNGGNSQFDQYTNSPLNGLNTQLAALGGSPLNAETNQSYKPGALDWLGLGAQTGGQYGQGSKG
jgi:hypothetical protein